MGSMYKEYQKVYMEKPRKLFIHIVLVVLLLSFASTLNAQTYGLKFQGQDVTLDKRTELDLSPDKYLKFQDEFEISFDYKIDLINRNSLFGYVLRVISQENNNIDLISATDPYIPLNLVIGKNNSIVPVNYFEGVINHWINLRIKFIMSEDRMVFYTPDTFYVQNDIGFKRNDAFKIIFGANDYKQFKSTDVPSMNIKNIKLFEKGKLKYHWPLAAKEGNIAIDRVKGLKAYAKNPSWLTNSHQVWQLRSNSEVHGSLMVAYDVENDRIFMVGKEFLLIYSAFDNNIQKIKYSNKPNFINRNYSSIYNSNDGKIYCYLADESPFYCLNIETGEWNETGLSSSYETRYRHHNRYFNPGDNSIYLFGGYGQHRYENGIRKIDINENKVVLLHTSDSIFKPRYLAGLGALDDTIYIFGGYGSESGNQLINPQSYYDLLGYSINDSSLFKKFEIPRIIDNMTVANSMWIDEFNRDYFALIFEKTKFDGYLQLIKGNLDSPKVEMVGNKIPFQFLDIRSLSGLIYMPQQKELFAYTSYATDSTTTQVKIHSISYPPNIFVDEAINPKKSKGFAYLFIVIAFILLISTTVWFYMKKKKTSTGNSEIVEKDFLVAVDSDRSELVVDNPVYHLIFFGGFQVFNSDFVDITNKFSPLLKELFLLIMLHTLKDNKGISSEKITEILWFDKTEKSARNNRAVNIAKLRNILGEVCACSLTKKTGYWKIITEGNSIKSDYLDFLNITTSKANITKQYINRLIKITEKGAFLQNVQYEWLDKFKATASDTIIDTLIDFAKSCDIKKEAEFIIHLSDSVFNFDIVNEDAMILKCKAQSCMGKHSHAKVTYEKFFKDYVGMYGQEYKQSFLEIIEIKK